MRKHTYTHNETRVYRDVTIRYDSTSPSHPWTIQVIETTGEDICRSIDKHFVTLAAAKREIDDFHKKKIEFKLFVPVSELVDSMLLDSGQYVATLKYKGFEANIRVCGEVDVEYEGSDYKAACQMPEELLAKFRDNSAYSDPDVNIIDNNWFEVFIDKDDKWTGYSEVIDMDSTENDIQWSLMYIIDYYINEYESNAA